VDAGEQAGDVRDRGHVSRRPARSDGPAGYWRPRCR
jgi:hypothetical protein